MCTRVYSCLTLTLRRRVFVSPVALGGHGLPLGVGLGWVKVPRVNSAQAPLPSRERGWGEGGGIAGGTGHASVRSAVAWVFGSGSPLFPQHSQSAKRLGTPHDTAEVPLAAEGLEEEWRHPPTQACSVQ